MKTLVAVALGGAAGSVSRYLVSNWAAGRFGADFPYGTLAANLAGCLVIGIFMGLATERIAVSPEWRLLIATGYLGGLTTFSSFSYETVRLLQENAAAAFVNIALNLLAGLGATWSGLVIARVF